MGDTENKVLALEGRVAAMESRLRCWCDGHKWGPVGDIADWADDGRSIDTWCDMRVFPIPTKQYQRRCKVCGYVETADFPDVPEYAAMGRRWAAGWPHAVAMEWKTQERVKKLELGVAMLCGKPNKGD